MSPIRIIQIVRHVDERTRSGAALSIYNLTNPNIGVVHAISLSNERCWIVYELMEDVALEPGQSIQELVCEHVFEKTNAIFVALHTTSHAA